MTQPHVEHIPIQTDRPAERGPGGFWPPLPVGLWLPPVACLFLASALILALCLSGPQATLDTPSGWLEPHHAPVLLTWVSVLVAVFVAPQFCAPTAAPGNLGWKIVLPALAVGLPMAAVAWSFHSVAMLLDSPAAAASLDAADAAPLTHLLPPGLPFALSLGLVAAGCWVWIRRWPVTGTVLLAAWSGLPPLAWFLTVDVLGRDPAYLPGLLTVNPVYTLVLLARQPALLPGWSLPILLVILAAAPPLVSGLGLLRRRSAPKIDPALK